ncbi:hypothetical protein RND81_04G002100 [Saponaria officinalis]|uniref:DNA polymerase epsilon subunit n=1 Tax=Saponaria officinalis TaxID=3572 RepID=A0AAW1LGX3_SAPOF
MGKISRQEVNKQFRIRRYTLHAAALQDVLSFVNTHGQDDPLEALDLLLDHLDHLHLKSSNVDKDTIARVIADLLAIDADDHSSSSSSHSSLAFIDAFLVPKFRYDSIRNSFSLCTSPLAVHGNAASKAALYRDRFLLLSHRLSRNPHFSKPAFAAHFSNSASCEIVPIQNLTWQTGKRWIMGVISQLEDAHFFLEDLTASVELDLSTAKITTGFFTENTIVVAEGEMLPKGAFKVNTCGFPPMEDREESLSFVSGLDFFGCGASTTEDTRKLAEMEKKAVNDMFVVLSDIWLDDEKTIGKLNEVLEGYEAVEVVPSLFILMGSFCSSPCNLSFHSFASLRLQFGKLGKMIAQYPRLKEHSRFLLIPSPDDAGPSSVLPRPALPKYLTEELQKEIPNAVFMTNPCRIKFYSQEIVVFRRDLLYRMRRSCLIPPSTAETSDPFAHLVATIVHQSHLCPLPLTIQPISWNHDHSLHLFPTPHTIILGDRSEQKSFKYGGVTCFNPGSFSNEHTFVAYRPCNKEVELSAI